MEAKIKVGDKVQWNADGSGGDGIVVEVLEPTQDCPLPWPRIKIQTPVWDNPTILFSWEYSPKTRPATEAEHKFVADTSKHVAAVRRHLQRFKIEMERRSEVHDQSKFEEPELAVFAEKTADLAKLEYGSEAYKEALKGLGPALQHHYENNDHHPEHFENGVDGMDLCQLVEMYCDWCAASERMAGGSIEQSIQVNQKRFALSDQLVSIFTNTAKFFAQE